MPLTGNVQSNIRELESVNGSRGRPQKQIIAIAYSAARKKKGINKLAEVVSHKKK